MGEGVSHQGMQPLPVTCESMMHVAAILKKAGFKSVANYSHEARDRHGRAGFSWTRASKRAIGHAKRSDEVCPEIWETLADSRGIDPECWDLAADAPSGGIALWMVGTLFLLREAIGTLQVRCPFHMMEKLVKLQLARLGFDSIEDVPIGAYTLVAQRRDHFGASVYKQAMITEVQRLVRVAKDNFLIARDLVPENMTGHFMRRSGAKLMARKGCSFCDVDLGGGSMV